MQQAGAPVVRGQATSRPGWEPGLVCMRVSWQLERMAALTLIDVPQYVLLAGGKRWAVDGLAARAIVLYSR